MKRKLFLLLGTVIILMALFALGVQAEQPIGSNGNDAYDYPIKPGSNEWKAFTSINEKLEVCQIPEDVLNNMSTTGLVETVLNYPLLGLYKAYDNWQQGFDMLVSNSNGLQELLNRKDAGTELLARYRTMDPTSVKNEWTDVEKGYYSFSFLNIEMLLMQEPLLANLTSSQSLALATEATTKNLLMQDTYIYGNLNKQTNSLLIERASERQYSDRSFTSHVHTPVGTEVTSLQMVPGYPSGDEFSSATIAAADAEMAEDFPYATKVRSATNMYQCHSYAWYDQSTSNVMKIDSYYLSAYWTDGSYGQWTGAPYVGLKVRYMNNDHSAIIYQTSPNHYYQSKWGTYGLYTHSPSDCPYPNTTYYYYYRTY